MVLPILHKPQKDSPETTLVIAINAIETTLVLSDASIFEVDNITRLTLGFNTPVTETVKVVSYGINNTIVVERGSPSFQWLEGTVIARLFSSYDLEDIHEYLEDLNNGAVTNGNTHNHDDGDGGQIPTNGLLNNAVTTPKILDGSVTNLKLADPYDYYLVEAAPDDYGLIIEDGLFIIPVQDIHNGKSVVKLTARLEVASSLGNVIARVYNVTQSALVGTITITSTNRFGSQAIINYSNLSTNDELRIDVMDKGTGAKGLIIGIKVDKS